MNLNQHEKKRSVARAGRATITPRFNSDMLVTIREARGLTQKAVANAVGVTQPTIARWQSGSAEPDEKQLQILSEKLEVPANFFFIDRPRRLASMSDFYHRAMASAKRSDVKAVHAHCSIMDLRIDRLLDVAEIPEDRIPDVDPDNHKGDIELVASMTRAKIGVPEGPILNLSKVIEDAGGIVIDQDMKSDKIDALCRWIPALPKLFFINANKPSDRLRLSLAHELGHTVMHFNTDTSVDIAEEQANRFAGAFLMPKREFFADASRATLTLQTLASLKRKWRVSMQAIARRAKDLQIIDATRYKSIFVQLSQMGWRKKEPVEVPHEEPTAFRNMIKQHIDEGYTREDLAELLIMTPAELDEFLVDHYHSPTWSEGARLRLVR